MSDLVESTFLLRQAALTTILVADGNILTNEMCNALEQLAGAIKALDTATEAGAKRVMTPDEAAQRLVDLVHAMHNENLNVTGFLIQRMTSADRVHVLLDSISWLTGLLELVSHDDESRFDALLSDLLAAQQDENGSD